MRSVWHPKRLSQVRYYSESVCYCFCGDDSGAALKKGGSSPFKHPNTRFCLDISTRDGMPLRCCTLYENEVIRLQWSLMNGVRSGHFFFYADGILQYEGFWENPAILLENSKRGVVMIQLSLLSQHIIYRGGFHPTSYKRMAGAASTERRRESRSGVCGTRTGS